MNTRERSRFSNQVSTLPRQTETTKNGSKGTLIIIGGGAKEASLQAVADQLPIPKHLTVTTIASPRDPEYQFEKCKEGMKPFKIDFSHLSFKDIEDDDQDSYLDPETSGVYVTGGHQNLLMKRLTASRFSRELREYHANGGLVIGTSAGASFMGDIMPISDTYEEGFGFVPYIIDQHFTQGNRKGRLTKLVNEFPDRIGIGIDENTAVVYQNNQMQIMGEGQVYVLAKNGGRYLEEVELSQGDIFNLSQFNSSVEIAAGD